MTRLLVATTNQGKLREIAAILEGLPVELVTLGALPPIDEPEETGATFGENARLKALYYAAATGLPTVADDSGLEIGAFDGEPGVHSARWHGTDYGVKFQKIRERLEQSGLQTSDARFVCHAALARDGRIVYETEQTVDGRLSDEPRGHDGFGYDPIFLYPPLGVTLAEMAGSEKSKVSHRGKAFRAVREYLRTAFP
ncbi:MAG TPA: RdgB/HAM1 family non-canonical purine NTP pyrophosphatase [Vicinamibacterales bacterium]|nr:RdgB/HAM1 family non-canonical purine NTP pyrophosphatase [Vicinamibacterales bacterium]